MHREDDSDYVLYAVCNAYVNILDKAHQLYTVHTNGSALWRLYIDG